MRRGLLLVCFVLSAWMAAAQEDFSFRTGDILFQVGRSGSFNDAISAATSGKNDINYTHVGVVSIENDTVWVLEATMPFVAKTTLDKFLSRSRMEDGKPVVSVGRLKCRYRRLIPGAIGKMESLIGKPYDYVFDPDNDAYYCSEIIYISFVRPNGKAVFESKPMTFRDKNTGEFPPGWITHFERHKATIPEGVEGTNPGDMSRSRIIRSLDHLF